MDHREKSDELGEMGMQERRGPQCQWDCYGARDLGENGASGMNSIDSYTLVASLFPVTGHGVFASRLTSLSFLFIMVSLKQCYLLVCNRLWNPCMLSIA